MTLIAFADNPTAQMCFCQVWGIANPFLRPVTIRCAGCDYAMTLVFTSDTAVGDRDTKAFLIFELFARGWVVCAGKPFCPNCEAQ